MLYLRMTWNFYIIKDKVESVIFTIGYNRDMRYNPTGPTWNFIHKYHFGNIEEYRPLFSPYFPPI